MIKIWGRNTSSNVQKVMWAVGEIGLPHERIDIGGPFGKNREPAYLAMNPNGLVPTLEEEDGFLLWESNSIVRYLAAKHRAGVLEPADLRARARANAWMDWQLSVARDRRSSPCFWGLVRTPPEKRDLRRDRRVEEEDDGGDQHSRRQACQDRLRRGRRASPTATFPSAVMANRYRQLVPERPPFSHFERWYAAIAARPAFKDQVAAVPLA